jgi:hypothetical protein
VNPTTDGARCTAGRRRYLDIREAEKGAVMLSHWMRKSKLED